MLGPAPGWSCRPPRIGRSGLSQPSGTHALLCHAEMSANRTFNGTTPRFTFLELSVGGGDSARGDLPRSSLGAVEISRPPRDRCKEKKPGSIICITTRNPPKPASFLKALGRPLVVCVTCFSTPQLLVGFGPVNAGKQCRHRFTSTWFNEKGSNKDSKKKLLDQRKEQVQIQ